MAILEVPVDGGSFYVDLNEKDMFKSASATGIDISDLKESINSKDVKIEENISNIVKSFHEAFKSIKPEELSIEFGVEITLENGKVIAVLLANAKVVGHVTVKATWKKIE